MKEIDRNILRLALPSIVSNVTVPLLSLSDVTISGHMGSDLFLAAMGVGATMMSLSAWLFGFLRMGSAGLAANMFGSRNAFGLSCLLCRMAMIALSIGLIMIIFRLPLSELLISLLNPGEDVAAMASIYYQLCILAAPAQLGVMALSGWMVGMQSTFWPMIVAIVTNAVNIPLSIWFVFGADMGFPGLAYGTLIAQWIGFGLAIWCCFHIWRKTQFSSEGLNSEGGDRVGLLSGYKGIFTKLGAQTGFFSVNSNLFLRSICVMSVSMGMTYFAGSMGEKILGANAILIQFFTFLSFFMDGFAHAAEALVGKKAGERDRRGVKLVGRHILGWSGLVAILFMILYGAGGKVITSLLTDSGDIISEVMNLRWTMIALPLFAVWAFVFDGIYIGLTRTKPMFLATLSATILFFVINIGFKASLTPDILWIGFLTYLVLRGGILFKLYPSELSGL